MNATPTTVPNAHPLLAIWQPHIYAEFVTKNVDDAMATMTEDTHVLLVPVGTGGRGYEAVRAFYGTTFIPQIPADLEAAPISQTLGADCLVEEAVYSFTHTIAMDWMLPGVAPTGKRVEVLVQLVHNPATFSGITPHWPSPPVPLSQLGRGGAAAAAGVRDAQAGRMVLH